MHRKERLNPRLLKDSLPLWQSRKVSSMAFPLWSLHASTAKCRLLHSSTRRPGRPSRPACSPMRQLVSAPSSTSPAIWENSPLWRLLHRNTTFRLSVLLTERITSSASKVRMLGRMLTCRKTPLHKVVPGEYPGISLVWIPLREP